MNVGRRIFTAVAAGLGLLAALVVFLAVSADELPESITRVTGGPGPMARHGGLVIVYQVELGDADRDAVMDNVRTRLDALDIDGVYAWWEAPDRLGIAVPKVGDADLSRFQGLLGVGGELAFRMVVEDAPAMKALYREVRGDARARDLGIEAQVESWSDYETGRRFDDYYLIGPQRDAIAGYLGELQARRPELVPEAGVEILYEVIEPAMLEPAKFRTYLVSRTVELGGEDIAEAELTYSPQTNRPEVLVGFTRAGGERFGDLTAAVAGRKLAIVLDGWVSSAPVIMGTIRGGRATITMGGGDPVGAETEARKLIGALRAGALTVPMREDTIQLVEPTSSEAGLVTGRALFAGLAGAALFGLLLLGRQLGAAALADIEPGRPAVRRPWLRLGVTIAVPAAIWLLAPRVPLPTIDRQEWKGIAMGTPLPSLFSLGVISVLLAFVLVELAALLVPPWRKLRHGGFAGRGALGPWVLLLAVALAGLQGWMLARFYAQVGIGPLGTEILSARIPAVEAVTAASLVGGVLVLCALVAILDRWGLGAGWALVALAQAGGELERWVRGTAHVPMFERVGDGELVVALAAGAAIAVATLAVMRGPARGDPRPFVRAPAAGWMPISGALTFLALAGFVLTLLELTWPGWLVRRLALDVGMGEVWGFYGTGPRFAVTLALTVLLAGGFAWLFSRPDVWREGRLRLRGGIPVTAAEERAAFARATILGAAWAVGVCTIFFLAYRRQPLAVLPLGMLLVIPAVLTDLVAEWRARARRPDLVNVWPLHQVQLADEVAAVLASVGIAAHLRGLRYRSMMHFFGPEVPIAVMVPVVDAERAHKLLAERLGPR